MTAIVSNPREELTGNFSKCFLEFVRFERCGLRRGKRVCLGDSSWWFYVFRPREPDLTRTFADIVMKKIDGRHTGQPGITVLQAAATGGTKDDVNYNAIRRFLKGTR